MWDAVDKGPACIPNPRPRVWDTGRPGAHWRIEIPQASERGVVGGDVPPFNTRAPSGGGAGNDSGGQKQAVPRGRPTKPLPPTHSPGVAPFFRTFLPSSLGQTGLVWSRGLSFL